MTATPPKPLPRHAQPALAAALRYARAFRKDPIAFVGDRFARYGDLYATTFRGVPLYVTRHPEHIHEVLVARGASFKKPEEGLTARQLRRMLGRGLVTSNGDFWRRQRRMINPAFARKQLDGLGAAMVDKTRAMLDRWTPGETREVGADMMALTLGIVARTLFDHDPTGERDRIAGALGAFRDITGLAGVLPPWFPLPAVRRMRRSLADMDDIVYGLIDARLLLATIAQRFSLRLAPGHPVERLVAVTMSPRHGMKMTLRPRQ